jgi:hypothetical protein
MQRPERRLYHRISSSTAETTSQILVETNIKEVICGIEVEPFTCQLTQILKFYELKESELEAYELKLRIWICNTIVRPLLDKIDELNNMLAEKHTNLHIRIGQSPLDMLQTHKAELCNSWLPFILPYISAHNNQTYLVNRVRMLGGNIAMEDFKWNSGENALIRDESNCKERKHVLW